MGKELGQIHTVNQSVEFLGVSEASTPFGLANLDIPGQLSEQLQRTVRAGNYFKVCGIDINLGLDQQLSESFVLAGEIRYYAPTRGRCEAFRSAFKAMADQMANQGISMRDNPLYDFRAPLNTTSVWNQPAGFPNQATLDGTDGLSLNNAADGIGIFQVHNEGVRPQYDGSLADLYSQGFKTLLDSSGSRTDFVLNEVVPYTGNEMIAATDYETIPFQLSFSTDSAESTTATFQWRPDPALYLAVMCGQMQIIVNDMETSVSLLDNVTVDIAVMVSGWKSIMGNPDKKSKKKSRRMK